MITNIKRVLGFDVSSSVIGYCLLLWDTDKNTITYDLMKYHKPTKNGNIIERLAETKPIIEKLINALKPDYIGVEDIISFMPGVSSANTIITLALFNRMVGVAALEYLKKSPELFSVMQIRHGLKLNKELPKKNEMPALVSHHLGITFPYIYKKNGDVSEISEDMADGTAVALYYAKVLSGQIVPNKKKKKGKKSK